MNLNLSQRILTSIIDAGPGSSLFGYFSTFLRLSLCSNLFVLLVLSMSSMTSSVALWSSMLLVVGCACCITLPPAGGCCANAVICVSLLGTLWLSSFLYSFCLHQ